MSGLTTHILDTAKGVPAKSVKVTLFRVENTEMEEIISLITNDDGRTDQPLLSGEEVAVGVYQLHFEVGSYFDTTKQDDISFLNRVVIEFGITDETRHYHVPLLISPYGYSTYRGS